jgi:hypothetical protein
MPGTSPWRLDSTPEFRDSYRKLTRKNARLKDAIDKMMDRVEADPLSGDPKTGLLHGLRQVHVMDHWVLTWELRPEIVNRKFLPDLREVWFIEVEHHPE